MKQRTLLSALPLVLLAAPVFAQAPAPGAPAPAPAVAPAPAPAPAPAAAAPADAAPVVPAPLLELTPAPAEPAAAPAPTPVEPAKAKQELKPEAPPDKVTVAKSGFFQPSATLQIWAFGSHLENEATPDESWTSGFRIRRAELRIKGEIVPKTFGYVVMFDPARLLDFRNKNVAVTGQQPAPDSPGMVAVPQAPDSGSTSILQDAAVTYMTEYADVTLGQFKTPVSLEGVSAASKLYFPERALVSRKYGDRRDMGIKAEKKLEVFGYTLGLFSGEGQNRIDSNDQKDLALRLEVYPIKGLTAAVVGYTGVTERDLPGTKDRLEGDLKVDIENVLVQAEYIRGWDVAADGRRVPGHGFYVLAGYTFFDKLQPLVRIGALDPDSDNDEHGATELEYTAYELGANYYLKQHDAKLQLAGGFFDPEQRSAHTRFDLTLAAQIAF